MSARRHRLDGLLLALVICALWWAAARIAGPDALSGPRATLMRAAQFLASPSFWTNARATATAFAWACVYSVAGGLAIGLVLGSSRLATEAGEPILSVVYSLPKVTLYPIVLLIFGLSLSAKVAFGVLQGIFPIALLTIGALRNVRGVHLKTARVMGLTPRQLALGVLLPAALPEIVTGLRLGVTSALLGTVIAEFFASDSGVGFMLIRAMDANQTTDVMALALLLFAFGAGLAWVLLAAERKAHRIWR